MSYQVFARKYRPQTFDEVLGQDHVIQTLRNAIALQRISQAYLFVGPRGTGKTTTARILAKALNCTGGPKVDFDPNESICREIAEGICLDVLEIDGASNNGVEQVRELRENTKFAPSRGRYKIYYIDEVHMLSTAAFNALLKTLEEPPPHVKFIFATTEPNKILPTILSRCQRFDLRPISETIIAKHLVHIAREEGVDLEPMAAHTIAKGAEGGMRDAESMLDQLVAFCGESISEAQVVEIFGFTTQETVSALADAILRRQTVEAMRILESQWAGGKDLAKLLADLITYLRALLVCQVDAASAEKDTPPAVFSVLQTQASLAPIDRVLGLIDQFAEVDSRMRWAPNKKLHFEIGIIKAVQSLQESSLSDVIAALNGALESGGSAQVAPPRPVSQHSREEPRASVPPSEPRPNRVAEPEPFEEPSRGDNTWETLRKRFLMALGPAKFLGMENNRYRIGFRSADSINREFAESRAKNIEVALAELTGHPLKLSIELDESEASEDGLWSEEPEASISTPSHAASAQAPSPPTRQEENDFENDPLIQKALEIFQATIEEN